MLRVIGCITRDHDPGLLALACVVFLLTIQAGSIRMAAPTHEESASGRPANLRLAAAFATLAAGFWTAMFTALAGFRPDLHSGFDIAFCLLSFPLAALPAAVVLAVSQAERTAWPMAAGGGVMFGAGLLGIHVLSLRTLIVGQAITGDPVTLAGTLLCCAALATAGLRCLAGRQQVQAKVLLAASAMLLHLGAAAALDVPASPDLAASSWPLPTVLGSTSTFFVIALWFGAARLDRRMAEQAEMEATRLKRHAEAGFEGLIFEHGGVITDTNGAMLKLSGCDRQHLIGAHLPVLIKDLTLRSAPGQPSEHDLLQADGMTRPVEVLWRNGPEAGGHIIAVRDLTREKTALAQLQRLASYDTLTGLPNRDQFERTLQQILSPTNEPGPFALLYLDLDRFEFGL